MAPLALAHSCTPIAEPRASRCRGSLADSGTISGSGLDPHITIDNALGVVDRVAAGAGRRLTHRQRPRIERGGIGNVGLSHILDADFVSGRKSRNRYITLPESFVERIRAMNRLRSVLALVVSLSLWCGTARAEDKSEIARLAAALQPGEWVELRSKGYSQKTLMRGDDILAYCGRAAWDAVSQQALLVGQVHLKGPPSFIAYSVEENTWRRMPTPEWAEPLRFFHGYENNAADSARGVFYHHASDTRTVYKYVVADDKWTTLPELKASTGHGTALEYFPEMKSLVRVHRGEVHILGDDRPAWTSLAKKIEMGPYHNFAAYSAPAKVVLLGGGNGSGAIHRLDSEGRLTAGKSAPVDLGIGMSLNVVDPVSGELLVLAKKGPFLAYSPQKDEWRELPTKNLPFPKYNGHSVSAVALGRYGAVLFFSSEPQGMKTFLYRHAKS